MQNDKAPSHESQDAKNQSEWEDPNNWSTIYFSKRDSRSTVPKRDPRQGWTINFGHPKGAVWIYYLFLFFFMIGLMIGVGVGIGIEILD
ncbi:hypothetical protein HBA55_24405 [Pseudomaricurvus alkylphenolicus]|jgi:uncharacterized membrane protein|uniref:hypothetical protein n=1 Tax=Pseudomaricurvus alkylphenolicus TaxID=1306991 RepID=UPI001422786B|nr:hypothetical protein [Pseudomaricurvus alkylphenolicus]NIB42772.1 hypothetical protein [Pseudomaricurvus alkylphenolicus]